MKTPRVHCFIHEDFEDTGCMEEWFLKNGYRISYTLFYQDQYAIPNSDKYDWLVIMGGPMGTYDEDKYPWLKPEKAAIAEAIGQNKLVLGICLGAQLIANAMGSRVYPNPEKEIGWWPISIHPENTRNTLFETLPSMLTVFHWHGDTFDLPAGAVLLASSQATKNQAFCIGNKVLGLQFHFEVTDRTFDEMLSFGAHELVPGNYIQTADEMVFKKHHIAENNMIMNTVLDNLAKHL